MKHSLHLITITALLLPLFVSGESQSASERIWSYANWYESEENGILQKLAFTGRLQYDLFDFDEEEGGDVSDTRWRRARAGFKASVFNGITVHSEIDMDFENADPVYNRLTDSYIGWNSQYSPCR